MMKDRVDSMTWNEKSIIELKSPLTLPQAGLSIDSALSCSQAYLSYAINRGWVLELRSLFSLLSKILFVSKDQTLSGSLLMIFVAINIR